MYTYNNKTYLTWFDIDESIIKINQYIKENNITHLVGLARGSFNLIQALSNQNNLPYTILQYSTYDGNDKDIKPGFSSKEINNTDKLLFVDDIADTGGSIKKILEYFKDISIFTVVGKSLHPEDWNYVLEYTGWTIFPYEQYNFVDCIDCKHSEPCTKYTDKVHCNEFNKSFDFNHTCRIGSR